MKQFLYTATVVILLCIPSVAAEISSLSMAHHIIEELETIRQNAPELFNEPEVLQAIQELEDFLTTQTALPAELATRSKDNKILCSLLVKHNLVAQNLQVCNNTTLNNLTVNGTITGNFPAPSVICGVSACTIANLIAGATSEDIPDTLVLRDGGSFAATTITVTGMPGIIFLASNGNTAALQPSASTNPSYTAILPPNAGSAGFVLSTDGGNPATLTWVSAGGGGGGISSINGANAATQTLITSSAGTLFQVTPTSSSNNTIFIPYAGNLPNDAVHVGLITGADYYNFHNTFTTVLAATTCDTPSTLVQRDSTGNFVATTIALTGNSLINYSSAGGCNNGAGFVFAPANGNTAIGSNAHNNNTTSGASNTALGSSALATIMNGQDNTAIGTDALSSVANSGLNTAVGTNAGAGITGANGSNTAIGANAMVSANSPQNVAIGVVALQHDTAGQQAAVGYAAMNANTTGTNNSAFGYYALSANTAGAGSTALGYYALMNSNNTTASPVGNTAVGTLAMSNSGAIVSGCTAVGYYALQHVTVSRDTAVGFHALDSDIGGGSNTALGYYALQGASGNSNVGVGYYALKGSQSVAGDVGVGHQALLTDLYGINTAVGFQTLQAPNSSGNTGVGYLALHNTGVAPNNPDTAVGAYALATDISIGFNTAVGYYALNSLTSGSGANTAVGYYAMQNATNPSRDTALGYYALMNDAGSGQQTAVGYAAMNANTAGNSNTGVGYYALNANTSGNGSTALGYQALMNSNNISVTPVGNTAIGAQAMANVGPFVAQDTAVGYQALMNDTNSNAQSTAVGFQALASLNGNSNANENVAVGYQAGKNIQTSGGNVLVGFSAAPILATGSGSNVIIGVSTCSTATTASANVVIGSNAGGNIQGGANNIYIGESVSTAGDESNTIRIGTQGIQTSCFIAGIHDVTQGGATEAVTINSTGQLGITAPSSRRYKENIKDMDSYSEKLHHIRPVLFNYINDENKKQVPGLIAEELEQLYPEFVRYKNDLVEGIQYSHLQFLMLNEQQKDHAKIIAYENRFVQLEQEIAELKDKLQLLLIAQAA